MRRRFQAACAACLVFRPSAPAADLALPEAADGNLAAVLLRGTLQACRPASPAAAQYHHGVAALRQTRRVWSGHVAIGGGAPVFVQSMTIPIPADVPATVAQVRGIAGRGSELVRDHGEQRARRKAVPAIYDKLLAGGPAAPLIGDFHITGPPACWGFHGDWRRRWRNKPRSIAMWASAISGIAQFAVMDRSRRCAMAARAGSAANWGSLDQALLTRMGWMKNRLPERARRTRSCARRWWPRRYCPADGRKSWGLAADRIVISCR